MISVLYVIGVLGLIASLIIGISTNSFIGILLSLVGGIPTAVLFFALAKILENQDIILGRLSYQEEAARSYLIEKKECPKCKKEYDSDYSTCPYCGNRE